MPGPIETKSKTRVKTISKIRHKLGSQTGTPKYKRRRASALGKRSQD